MSLMDDIIDELQEENCDNKNRWIDTKIGWDNYKLQNNKNYSEVIKSLIGPKGKKEFRRKTNITFVTKGSKFEP